MRLTGIWTAFAGPPTPPPEAPHWAARMAERAIATGCAECFRLALGLPNLDDKRHSAACLVPLAVAVAQAAR